jgi:hypothetical protein
LDSWLPQRWNPFTDNIPIVTQFLHARIDEPSATREYPVIFIVLITDASQGLCRCLVQVPLTPFRLPLYPQSIISATLCIFSLLFGLIRCLARIELVQKSLSGMAGFVGWVRVTILRL